MTGQEAREEAVHWIGDAPTSLHGNGASSFARTTRDPEAVTCGLCRTLLAREARDDERDALAEVLARAYNASPYRDAHLRGADAILAAGYRKHPEPEITDEAADDEATEALNRAIGSVLFDVSNFPEPAQSRLLGQDMWPLRQRLVLAVKDAVAIRVPVGEGEQGRNTPV